MAIPPAPTTARLVRRRAYSRQSRQAVTVLGQLIRIGRIERALSVQGLAERLGVSRDLVQRIEHGDPRCGIGVALEAATIVGVPLFDADRTRLTEQAERGTEKLRLLPKAVRKRATGVNDDF